MAGSARARSGPPPRLQFNHDEIPARVNPKHIDPAHVRPELPSAQVALPVQAEPRLDDLELRLRVILKVSLQRQSELRLRRRPYRDLQALELPTLQEVPEQLQLRLGPSPGSSSGIAPLRGALGTRGDL